MVPSGKVKIRPMQRGDAAAVHKLIQDFASADQDQYDLMNLSVDQFTDFGFPQRCYAGNLPAYYAFVAEVVDCQGGDHLLAGSLGERRIVGYVLFYHTYDTARGRCVYMSDLYVVPDWRGARLGTRLWAAVAGWTINHASSASPRLVWSVNTGSAENPAEFYKKCGAVDLTERAGARSGGLVGLQSFLDYNLRSKDDSLVVVRKMVENDCPQVMRLVKEFNGPDRKMSRSFCRNLYATQLAADGFSRADHYFDPAYHGWVAVDSSDRSLIGYCLVQQSFLPLNGPQLELSDLWISHAAQGNFSVGDVELKLLHKVANWAQNETQDGRLAEDPQLGWTVVPARNRLYKSVANLQKVIPSDQLYELGNAWHTFQLDGQALRELAFCVM